MKKLIYILTILFFALNGQLLAQTLLPEGIKISCGYLRSSCRQCQDIKFDKQLYYKISDSIFYYKKKENKPFKKLDIKPPSIFFEPKTFESLDSLIKIIPTYHGHPYNSAVYRIELIFANGDIPSNIHATQFSWNDFINDGQSKDIVLSLVNEFLKIMKNAP